MWLWRRARRGDKVEIMVHEPFLPFGRTWKQTGAALVHRMMTIVLLRGVDSVWMSIPAWEQRLRPYALGRAVPFRWLPIPSNIPVSNNARAIEAVRRKYAPNGELLAGHFGTHGWPITPMLESILIRLGEVAPQHRVLLMGIGSTEFREELLGRNPQLTPMIHATGALSPSDLSVHTAACDLVLQPYPDGVSSRRTSVMLGLSHGKAVVTTLGELSEPLWKETGALALAPAFDSNAFVDEIQKLSADPAERHRMGQAARKLYESRFDVSYTIQALRGTTALEHAECAS
jgi:hypothetical protein